MILLEKLEQKRKHIILIMVICILIGLIYSIFGVQKKVIAETTLMLVEVEEKSENEYTSKGNIELTKKMVSNFEEIIKSSSSINSLKNSLKIDINVNELNGKIKVKEISNSDAFKLVVENSDANLATQINNALIKNFSEQIKTIYANTEIYIVDNTHIEENIDYSSIAEIIVLSIIIGIFVNLIYLMFLIELDKRVKKSNDLESELALKNLGKIPLIKTKNKLVIEDEKKSLIVAFRELRSNIQFINVNNKEKNTILVTSSKKLEGKTTIASNLAISFAKTGKKVILIDTNMNSGRVDKMFNIPNDLGLSNYLSGIDENGVEINERINKFVKDTPIKNLNIITSGTVPPNSSELLAMPKFEEMLKDLSVFYNVIILDGSPVLNETDALILARLANSTVIVSNYKKTKKDDLWHTKRDIQNVGGRIIGIIINRVKVKEESDNLYNKVKKFLKENYLKLKDYIVTKRDSRKQKLLEAAIIEEKQKVVQELKEEENKLLEEIQKERIEEKAEQSNKEKISKLNIFNNIALGISQIKNKEISKSKESKEVETDITNKKNNKIENAVQLDITNKENNKSKDAGEIKLDITNKENNKLKEIREIKQNIENKPDEEIEESLFNQTSNEIEKISNSADEAKKVDDEKNLENTLAQEVKTTSNENINSNIPNNNQVKEKIANFWKIVKDKSLGIASKANVLIKNASGKVGEFVKKETEKVNEIKQQNEEKKVEKIKEEIAQEKIKESIEIIKENSDKEENSIIEKQTIPTEKTFVSESFAPEEKDENSVLVIVDAENGYCRAFSQYCFTEKLIRGIDKTDGFVKANYSSNFINRKRFALMSKYELNKKQVERIDTLIYTVLLEYDECVWLERKMVSNKAEEYVLCMAKDYERSLNETRANYELRCQYLRKVELAKYQIEIEYKLDNAWSSNQINFTDKIVFYNFAKKYENLKERKKAEDRENNLKRKNTLKNPINLLKKIKIDEVKVKSVEELTKEVTNEYDQNDYENYQFEDFENYNNYSDYNNYNSMEVPNFQEQEQIRIEEERRLKEEEQLRIKQEIKEKRAYEKAQKREARNRKRAEHRKRKELERQKAKEEARIEEELLVDNLYPKTKNNKNL